MLTPETLKALDQALSAVVQEAGDDPKYEGLVHALSAAQDAMPDSHAEKAEDAPDDSFAHAKERFIAANKERQA
jgi:hypothetical protein